MGLGLGLYYYLQEERAFYRCWVLFSWLDERAGGRGLYRFPVVGGHEAGLKCNWDEDATTQHVYIAGEAWK